MDTLPKKTKTPKAKLHILQEIQEYITANIYKSLKNDLTQQKELVISAKEESSPELNNHARKIIHLTKKEKLCDALSEKINKAIDSAVTLLTSKSESKKESQPVIQCAEELETILWALTILHDPQFDLSDLEKRYKNWLKKTYGQDALKTMSSYSHVSQELKLLVDTTNVTDLELKEIIEKVVAKTDKNPIEKKKKKKKNEKTKKITSLKTVVLKAIECNQPDTFYLNQTLNVSCASTKAIDLLPIQRYNELVAKHTKEKFIDPEFPPNESSISKHMDKFKKGVGLEWKRIHELFPNAELKVFSDIGPHNISQGKLGDCYFLSSMTVLSERPHLIKRLFHTQEYSQQGIYSIWLCDSGEWKNIIIDDYIPVKPKTNQPAFTRSPANNLWVMLLEKAFAKLYGSYHNIQAGIESEAMRILTGAPAEYYDTNNSKDSVWDWIMDHVHKGRILACNSKDQEEENSKVGIVNKHSYAVLGAKPYKNFRLIKIRNPWGCGEWKGDWSDKSGRWTEEAQKEVGYNPAGNDGIFWMELEDWKKHYGMICACHIYDHFHYKFLHVTHNPEEKSSNISIIQVKVTKKSHVYVTIGQKDARHYKRDMDYDYSWFNYLFVKVGENFAFDRFIKGGHSKSSWTTFDDLLEEGTYVIYVDFQWSQRFVREFILSTYSEHHIEFYNITDPDNTGNINVLKDMLIAHATKGKTSAAPKDYSKKAIPGCENIKKYNGTCGGFTYFYYENKSENLVLAEKLTFTITGHIPIEGIADNTALINLPPGKTKVIVLQLDGTCETSKMSYNTSTELEEHPEDEELIKRALDTTKPKCANEALGIYFHNLKYGGGEAMLFINKGAKKVKITFSMKDSPNYKLNGEAQEKDTVYVPAGQNRLIRMDIIDIFGKKSLSYGYAITPVSK